MARSGLRLALWCCLCGPALAFLAPLQPLRGPCARRPLGLSMHARSDGSLSGDLKLITDTLASSPGRLRDEGAKAAIVELGRDVTSTDLYRVWTQGTVVAGLGALHVVNPELLQTVGLFHLSVCLPVAIAAAQAKGHQVAPAVAKTLLVGGLAAAEVFFATDDNQIAWPLQDGSSPTPPVQTEDERLDEKLGLSEPRFPVAGTVGQQVGEPVAAVYEAPGGGGGGAGEQLKVLLAEYGKVGLLVHFSIQLSVLAVVYTAISTAGDPAATLASLLALLPQGLGDAVASKIDPSAGTFAVAFVLTKASAPVRIAMDLAVTPIVADALRNTAVAGILGLKPERA
ncbi:hypothetical protein T484DRAFT_1946373 [Baffinella frigidus]|nr:hypothetical protein T484DRAFT_1946373 [Cryptophyta sp. CCMP2293]